MGSEPNWSVTLQAPTMLVDLKGGIRDTGAEHSEVFWLFGHIQLIVNPAPRLHRLGNECLFSVGRSVMLQRPVRAKFDETNLKLLNLL